MLFHAYILRSKKTDKLYIGSTGSIEERLRRHNTGRVPSTSAHRPWELVAYIPFSTRSEAVKLERRLKGWKNPTKVLQYINELPNKYRNCI